MRRAMPCPVSQLSSSSGSTTGAVRSGCSAIKPPCQSRLTSACSSPSQPEHDQQGVESLFGHIFDELCRGLVDDPQPEVGLHETAARLGPVSGLIDDDKARSGRQRRQELTNSGLKIRAYDRSHAFADPGQGKRRQRGKKILGILVQVLGFPCFASTGLAPVRQPLFPLAVKIGPDQSGARVAASPLGSKMV